ncbi:9420_t:CDS:2 [Dentiscutata heterogama]|uniref:9420_t:CDS:1 n=1 Tax=Dentiscutata heterogama TaxID=1316150 RepID=A0ACA9M4C7_9GLOM|nr:9420_t:CDS:2 [Dentiscutata heterogama]
MSVLNSGDYADVILRIGDDEHFKEFRAHSIVLRTRSPYFRTALSDRWAQKQDNVIIYEKPNILPEAFEVILNGVLDLKIHDVKIILNILVACKELCLLDLFDYMQDYLLNNMSEAMQQNFSLVQRIASQHNAFSKLQRFIKKFMDHNPHLIFKTDDFNTLEQHILISLLQRDDLLIEEIDVWEAVVQWGIANTSSLPTNKDDWTKDNYSNLGATLEPCIAHIKFGQITSEDFFQKVEPYKEAIDKDLYDEIVKFHSGAAAKSKSTIPLSQRRGVDSVLIGDLDSSILSRSVGTISSICNSPLHGPVFRGILIFNGDFKNDCASYCNFDKATTPYEGPIRKTKDKFSVDELEVFQIIKKKL